MINLGTNKNKAPSLEIIIANNLIVVVIIIKPVRVLCIIIIHLKDNNFNNNQANKVINFNKVLL